MSTQSVWRFRPFISVLTAFSFLVVVVTGVVLFITPPGRIANWSNWAIWGLSRNQWIALHICFCLLFTVVSILHIILNIRPLMNYFASRIQSMRKLRYEWIAALLLCGLAFWGAIKPFAPFSSLLALNTRVKNSWDSQAGQQPPVPHAELLTITQLAAQANVPVDTILANLKSAGIEAGPDDIFGTIADEAGYSPEKLFAIAAGQPETQRRGQRRGGSEGQGENRGSGGSGGPGFGQQTLTQVCQELNIDIPTALETLRQSGITATADQSIRQIADENNIRPGEIRQLLQRQ